MTFTFDEPMASSLQRVESRLGDRRISLFGLDILDLNYDEAVMLLDAFIRRRDRARAAYFVNAHTLNHANRSHDYQETLTRAECLFGDGTGVRWALRLIHGVRLRANLNGTDLVPYFMRETSTRGYRVFLLGSTNDVLASAANTVEMGAGGWEVCGMHHGFVASAPDERRVVEQINRSRADLLLVAMGNPKQELWIDRHLGELEVPLSMGVGALFDYWAGVQRRAPLWMRQAGAEWLYRLLFHSGKRSRYLLGNPEFLWAVARERWRHQSDGDPLSGSPSQRA